MQTIIKIVLLALIISLFLISTKVIAEAPKYIEQPPNIKVYAFEKVLDRWGSEQWDSFDKIISKESINWTITGYHYPESKKSSAYGLCGTLVITHNIDIKNFDEYMQVDWCIDYINNRYKTPDEALKFHYKNNWF